MALNQYQHLPPATGTEDRVKLEPDERAAADTSTASAKRSLKLVVPCSTLDLNYRLGCTPSWWQLLKAFHELGHEVIATPYLGNPIESLWWRTYPNPCRAESVIYNRFLDGKKKRGKLAGRRESASSPLNRFAERYVNPRWKAHLTSIMEKEKDVSAVLFMNVPINHIKGIPTFLRKEYGVPVMYLEGDMPTILPKYAADRGFKFSYYSDIDLSEFDVFFTNSKGVAPDLRGMGAKEVQPIYYAIDPELFKPIDVPKDIDISYFGYGSEYREEWMERMIAQPSLKMADTTFRVGGGGYRIDLGKAQLKGDMSYSAFRRFCCESRICLNITRKTHTAVEGSSTARPFELAGFGACIVSQPYNGIEEWFDVGREMKVVTSAEEAIDTYASLLEEPEEALVMGRRARERVCRDHTFQNRAGTICDRMFKAGAGS